MFKVFIDGKEGTTGLRILDRFGSRDDITVLEISDDLRKDKNERVKKINESDITFLCLPDDASKEIVELTNGTKAKIIDASTAFRCDDDWAYGLPELSKNYLEKVKNFNKISVPGCHASGSIAIIAPLISNNIVEKNYPFTITSLTGYSGGGKKMIAEYENPHTIELDAPRVYGLNQKHKHLPEIKKHCNLETDPIFLPIVAPYYAGMLVTVGIINKKNISLKDIHEIYKNFYKDQDFIKVIDLPDIPTMLSSNILAKKDYMKIFVCGNDDRITIHSQFDNLGKGASGAAIECMNIALGLSSTKGLDL
ncbi:MAG: N-acetyl-gamma-glutamyl-phosphate reductase [Fusobacteriaceae bacterium]|jgi:N-acetyl-gamma-glutamyl-phosphate reductase|nr:N-acetyl-gamma-glutamyl-phosphate reductase [Fusobacteriaceae bacterium]